MIKGVCLGPFSFKRDDCMSAAPCEHRQGISKAKKEIKEKGAFLFYLFPCESIGRGISKRVLKAKIKGIKEKKGVLSFFLSGTDKSFSLCILDIFTFRASTMKKVAFSILNYQFCRKS